MAGPPPCFPGLRHAHEGALQGYLAGDEGEGEFVLGIRVIIGKGPVIGVFPFPALCGKIWPSQEERGHDPNHRWQAGIS